jgi:acyl-CoA thioester hydrolase
MSNLQQLQQEYQHVYPVPVKWGEMDSFQHVNNVAYIRYLEDGRLAIFEQLGMSKDLKATNKGPIFANLNCDFLAPVTYPDTVYVASNIKQTGPKKIVLEQVIYSEQLGQPVFKATSLCVYYDYATLRSCEVTDTISTAINNL